MLEVSYTTNSNLSYRLLAGLTDQTEAHRISWAVAVSALGSTGAGVVTRRAPGASSPLKTMTKNKKALFHMIGD